MKQNIKQTFYSTLIIIIYTILALCIARFENDDYLILGRAVLVAIPVMAGTLLGIVLIPTRIPEILNLNLFVKYRVKTGFFYNFSGTLNLMVGILFPILFHETILSFFLIPLLFGILILVDIFI